MKLTKYYLIFCQLWWLDLENTMAVKSLDILSHRCHHNAKYIEAFNISMLGDRISFVMRNKIQISSDMKFNIVLERGLNRAGPYTSLFKSEIELCKMISSYRNNLFKRWFLSFTKHGRMPNYCPWPVDEYYIRDWQLRTDLVPPFVGAGFYKSKSASYFGSFGSDSYELLVECDIIFQFT